jgi:lysozyme
MNDLRTSINGRKLIEEFEGLILGAYDDFNDRIVKPGDKIYGTLTIGYGHTTAAGPPTVYPGMVITQAQADQILAADLASVEVAVNHAVRVPLSQNQFDSLVSFAFNVGDGAFAKSNVLASINGYDFGRVGHDLSMWVYGNGQLLPGLVRRRGAEADLFYNLSDEQKQAPTANQDVLDLQTALNKLGYQPTLVLDGEYGPATKAAVKWFQTQNHLLADGINSATTWAAIQSKIKGA